MNKFFTLFLMLVALSLSSNAQRFNTQWSQCVNSGNMPEWFGSYTERGIAATNQYVYVATRNNDAGKAVKYFDPKTGVELGELNVTGVSEGCFLLNDVETSDDGQILACNMAFYHEQWAPDGSWKFKIYKWSDKDAAPEVLISYENSEQLRMGDLFTVAGDLSGSAVIYVPISNQPKVYRWSVVNGQVSSSPEIIELQNIVKTKDNVATLCNFPKVAPLGVTKDDPFIYSANGVFPMKISADGTTILDQLNAGNFTSESGNESADENAAVTFEVDGQTYLATLALMGQSATNNTQVKAINITDGMENASNPVFSNPLGAVENGQWNGDIAYATIDGEVYVYLLYSNAGMAAYKFDPYALPELNVPVTATGWRRCALDSIEGRSTQPEWLDETSRALAYGNGHLYVVQCGENNIPGKIHILSAEDGSSLNKELNVDLVNETNSIEHANTIRISDVEVDDAGHILACNVRLKEKPFTIFAWDDENSEPYKLVEVMPPFGTEDAGAAWQQTAYYFDVKGDIKGNAVIIVSRSNYASSYKWVIKDGVVQNDGNPYVTLYNLPEGGHWGPYSSATIESADENANVWIDGDVINPICFDSNGDVISVMPEGISTVEGQPNRTAVKFLEYAGQKFILEWNWVWADHTRLINVSGDIDTWEGTELQEVGSYMGQNTNTFYWGDVDYHVDGDTLYVFTLSTNNGVKMDKVVVEPPEVIVPVTESGWRRCSLDSVEGVTTKPNWLRLNSRAVAAGNGHIYVVNCSAGNAMGEIIILDAKNGSKLDKKLKVNAINEANNSAGDGTLRISDVEVDDAGHILASNLRGGTVPFSVFVWDDEDSEPYKLVEITPPFDIEDPSATWHQTAYTLDVKGDVETDAVIVVGRSNYPSTYKWVISDGVVLNDGNPIVTIHDLPSGGHWGAYGSACVESADPYTNIWVDGDLIDPICYDTYGGIIGIMPPEVATSPAQPHRTTPKYLEYANKKFILEWNWVWADHTRLIDITGDLMELSEDNAEEIGTYMGQEPNPLYWGDVDYFIENDTLNIVTLSTNNGIKLDKYHLEVTAAKIVDKGSVKVYPNPAKNKLFISHSSGCKSVELFNLVGKSVKKVMNVNSNSIDISDLINGVYFVKVTPNNGDAVVRKIVKN